MQRQIGSINITLEDAPPPVSDGVQAMFLAQLIDCYEVLQEYRENKRFTRQVWRDYRWLVHEGEEWPFAFRTVCFGLGIEPAVLLARFRDEGLITEELADRVWRREHPRRPKKPRNRPRVRPKRPAGEVLQQLRAWTAPPRLRGTRRP